MEIKVAVASSDGKTVNEHFGRTRSFLIYRLTGDQWRQVEERTNLPACSGRQHDDNLLERTAELLSDCRGVVVSQIGPTAMDTLLYRNILPFVLNDTVDDALAVVLASKLFLARNKILIQ